MLNCILVDFGKSVFCQWCGWNVVIVVNVSMLDLIGKIGLCVEQLQVVDLVGVVISVLLYISFGILSFLFMVI